MPFGGLGMWEVLLILLVLLLVFGAKRLPELGGSLGKGIREFKKSVREIETELNRSVFEEPKLSRGTAQAQQVPSPATPPAAEPVAQPAQPQAEASAGGASASQSSTS